MPSNCFASKFPGEETVSCLHLRSDARWPRGMESDKKKRKEDPARIRRWIVLAVGVKLVLLAATFVGVSLSL